MSSFSRGASRILVFSTRQIPWHRTLPQSPCHIQSLLRLHLRRAFQSTPRRHVSSKAPAPRSGPSSTAPLRRGIAEQLALKNSATLLYEAPSHTWFRISSLGAGTFCIAFSLVNYWSVYPQRENLSWWIMPAYAVICVVMSGLGTYFIMGSSRVVRAIRAVPASQLAYLASTATAAAGKKGAGAATSKAAAATTSTTARSNTTTPLFIEVELGRMLPFLPARKLHVKPEEVTLPFRINRIFASRPTPTTREAVNARRTELERNKKHLEYERNHLMTAPFRHFGQAVGSAWRGVRRALTQEGFAGLMVKDGKYKLDLDGAWVLDQGRVLDRLCRVRQGM